MRDDPTSNSIAEGLARAIRAAGEDLVVIDATGSSIDQPARLAELLATPRSVVEFLERPGCPNCDGLLVTIDFATKQVILKPHHNPDCPDARGFEPKGNQ